MILNRSLHEVIVDNESKVYFGNTRTVAENGDSRFTRGFWLVDLLVNQRDGRYIDIALGWYAIHCIMDDFGELVCDVFNFVADENDDNLLEWMFATAFEDGRIDLDSLDC